MTPESFTQDIVEFLDLLDRRGVQYLLIGGHAVHFHGYSRFTSDIDFAYCPRPDNAERLYAALADFWGSEIPNVRSPADLQEPSVVIQFERRPNRIDLINNVKGIDFDQAWSRRVVEPLDGTHISVSVISLVDLRRSKAAAGRLKDLDDLLNLPVPPEDPR